MGLLFAIAHYGDKRADAGRSIISNPYIYALSLAVYCTAWTFYGSVGLAVRSGLGFLPIYIGPTLMALLGWWIWQKIIRISKTYHITSIADFIASRYGKNTTLGGLVSVIAVIGIIPYISIQLKAISKSFLILTGLNAQAWIGATLHLPAAGHRPHVVAAAHQGGKNACFGAHAALADAEAWPPEVTGRLAGTVDLGDNTAGEQTVFAGTFRARGTELCARLDAQGPVDLTGELELDVRRRQIGRASCRERV